jgi:hypothetical protein
MHSLCKRKRLSGDPAPKTPGVDHEAENRQPKRGLARVIGECDILKKDTLYCLREAR